MVESLSPVPDFVTSPELKEGIEKDRITTFTVTETNLPDYLNAAINLQKTDNLIFKVTVIAGPGEHYPTGKATLSRRRDANGRVITTSTITAEQSKEAVRQGSVAISLEKPEGVTNDIAFNRARQQEEAKRLREEERAAKKRSDS